jgi:hypothetical protein
LTKERATSFAAVRSLAVTKITQQVWEAHGLTALALSDRFEQHSFGLSISLKSLVAVSSQYRYRGTFGQLSVEFDTAVYDLPGGNDHDAILPPVTLRIAR